jgi:hypothetical protein
MSLARAAARIAAIHAILGRTLVGDAVFDSERGVLDQVESGEISHAPMIVVYTDKSTRELEGAEAFRSAGKVELVFEALVTTSPPQPRAPGEQVTLVAETDGQMELMLDLIEWQIQRAIEDPPSEWAGLLDAMVISRHSNESQRAKHPNGARYAARQLTIEVDLLSEPMPSGPPTGVWADFIAALRADGGTMMAMQADVFEQSLDPETGGLDLAWQDLAARYGLSGRSARTLGVASEAGDGDPVIAEFEVQPTPTSTVGDP